MRTCISPETPISQNGVPFFLENLDKKMMGCSLGFLPHREECPWGLASESSILIQLRLHRKVSLYFFRTLAQPVSVIPAGNPWGGIPGIAGDSLGMAKKESEAHRGTQNERNAISIYFSLTRKNIVQNWIM